MRSCCDLIGQCLGNNYKTIESKDSHSMGRDRSLFCYGGTGRHRKMAAYFFRAVQGGIVGKGLTQLSMFSCAGVGVEQTGIQSVWHFSKQ